MLAGYVTGSRQSLSRFTARTPLHELQTAPSLPAETTTLVLTESCIGGCDVRDAGRRGMNANVFSAASAFLPAFFLRPAFCEYLGKQEARVEL